jgi:hypothetical protein
MNANKRLEKLERQTAAVELSPMITAADPKDARRQVERWHREHPNGLPPMVVYLTDDELQDRRGSGVTP